MKRIENGDSCEITVSLWEVLTAIEILKGIKKIGKEVLSEDEFNSKATELVECMQVAIDVMILFIQEKYQGAMERLEEELKKIKEAQNDSGGTETAESTEPEV